jgi:hypothetical protein
MSDILEDMHWLVERLKADGDPNGDFRESNVAMSAIAEIEHLRAKIVLLHQIAGKASVEGQSFADIRKETRK